MAMDIPMPCLHTSRMQFLQLKFVFFLHSNPLLKIEISTKLKYFS